jgi:hypothetical protein
LPIIGRVTVHAWAPFRQKIGGGKVGSNGVVDRVEDLKAESTAHDPSPGLAAIRSADSIGTRGHSGLPVASGEISAKISIVNARVSR